MALSFWTAAFWLRLKIILALALLMVLVHTVNVLLDGQLNQYGIIPRSAAHWFHIFTAPFIHGDMAHLINNLFGLAVFSAFCLLRPVSLYLLSSVFIIVLSGSLVWLFARSAIHIGASGWIFGLWSLSIAMAWFDRSLINILSGLAIVFLYGGMAYGVLPSDPKVSFEGHLFGAISGVVFAFLYSVFLKFRNRKGPVNV